LPSGTSPEDVFYDAAARFLDVQVSTDDVLDDEASRAFGVGSTVLPLTFGLLNLGPNRPPDLAVAFLIVALVAYLLLVACAWRASALRVLEYRPHIPTLQEHSEHYDGNVLRRWVAEEYAVSGEANRAVIQRKARWSGAAVSALYAEAVFLALAAVRTLL
jgi:hypothetical protein